MMKPIFLWAVPRSGSTAIERIFIERGDFDVLHEPFSQYFYFSDERQSNRYAEVEPNTAWNFDNIYRTVVEECSSRRKFVKEISFHVTPRWEERHMKCVDSLFLIRRPEFAFRSQYRIIQDFSFEETGYCEIERLFEMASDCSDKKVMMCDIDEFLSDPVASMKKICEYLAIDSKEVSLTWTPRAVPAWKTWQDWHTDASESTGLFRQMKRHHDVILPRQYDAMLAKASDVYERLYLHCERSHRE